MWVPCQVESETASQSVGICGVVRVRHPVAGVRSVGVATIAVVGNEVQRQSRADVARHKVVARQETPGGRVHRTAGDAVEVRVVGHAGVDHGNRHAVQALAQVPGIRQVGPARGRRRHAARRVARRRRKQVPLPLREARLVGRRQSLEEDVGLGMLHAAVAHQTRGDRARLGHRHRTVEPHQVRAARQPAQRLHPRAGHGRQRLHAAVADRRFAFELRRPQAHDQLVDRLFAHLLGRGEALQGRPLGRHHARRERHRGRPRQAGTSDRDDEHTVDRTHHQIRLPNGRQVIARAKGRCWQAQAGRRPGKAAEKLYPAQRVPTSPRLTRDALLEITSGEDVRPHTATSDERPTGNPRGWPGVFPARLLTLRPSAQPSCRASGC